MNLDELQSVQSRERQIDSLQQLHDAFYEDAGRFIRQLREEREQVAAAADDPFDSTDVQRLTDEIDTAERTVEAIYERRIGKLVKQASLEAAGMAADVEGLTREERSAFDSLVSTIESNRTRVLDEVLANAPAERDSDTASADPESRPKPDPESEFESESETTASSASPSEASTPPDRELASEAPDGNAAVADASVDASSAGNTSEATADGDNPVAVTSDPQPPPETTSEDAGDVPVHARPAADSPEESVNASLPEHPDVERVTVRITNDVGEILCVDDRAYELSTDDIVTLPKPNAQPLIDHDAATRLEER